MKYVPDEVEALSKHLADQYLCNFSLFQSMPDHWAIQHLFPIARPMNMMRSLATKPRRGHHPRLGRQDACKFIDLRDDRLTRFRCTRWTFNEPYYLGFFLMGAYQDIMGDLHNLFGRVNEVHVFLDETEPGG